METLFFIFGFYLITAAPAYPGMPSGVKEGTVGQRSQAVCQKFFVRLRDIHFPWNLKRAISSLDVRARSPKKLLSLPEAEVPELLFRRDDDFFAATNKFGVRKSHIDPHTGSLVPAEALSGINYREHIGDSFNPAVKGRSPYISFSAPSPRKHDSARVFSGDGKPILVLSLRKLLRAASDGHLNNLDIITCRQLTEALTKQLRSTLAANSIHPAASEKLMEIVVRYGELGITNLQTYDSVRNGFAAFLRKQGFDGVGLSDEVMKASLQLSWVIASREFLIRGNIPREFFELRK